MKKISIFLVSCIAALSVFAQYNTGSTVKITVTGNQDRQVLVDGKNYSTINDNTVTTNPRASDYAPGFITITDLQPGQHTLELVRSSNQYNNRRRNNTRTFNTRSGYDVELTVANDGSVTIKETRRRRNWNANQYRTPMSDAAFTTILQSVQREWRSNAKRTAVTNAF